MITIEQVDPSHPDAEAMLAQLSTTLVVLTGSSGESSFDPQEMDASSALFVLARDLSGSAVGCGALRPLKNHVAEIKRMFAVPGSRGVGAALLSHLESTASAIGYKELWLETRRINVRAVSFYGKHGYREIPNFGRYVGRAEAICLGKRIGEKGAA